MKDPKLAETLKKLKSARKGLDKVIESLEQVSASGLQSRDLEAAQRLAGRWVKEEAEGIDPASDDLNDECPSKEPMAFDSTMGREGP